MSGSKYAYGTRALPGTHDVWETVAPVGKPTGKDGGSDKRTLPVAPQAPLLEEPDPARPREQLNQWGQALVDKLPPGLTLDYTSSRYPHIVNRIAVLWDDARALGQYLENLLLDDRKDRQGFAFEALMELTSVKDTRLAELRLAQRGFQRNVPK